MNVTGVYMIRCTNSGKHYVGSSTSSIEARWQTHRSHLRCGRHPNRHLQSSWNKHGESAFIFEIIEECSVEDCIAREQFWIDNLEAANPNVGYNLRPIAKNNLGLVFSEASRKKVSIANKGKKHSEETRLKISASAKRRGMPADVLAKAHAARRGKPLTDEQKAKQSASLRGRKYGPERGAKVAEALKGRKHSPEVCANMSAGQMGKKHSEATKAKMSKTRKGRTYSDAHRKAISDGHQRRALDASQYRGKSQYRGVQPEMMPSGNMRYRAVISLQGTRTCLGSFKTEAEAAEACFAARQRNSLAPMTVASARRKPSAPLLSFMTEDSR